MYRSVFLFIFLLAFSATSKAQTMSADQVSQDSTINIVAYFCKNDTIDYVHHDFKAKVIDNDTTVNHHFISEIRLIVRDSTSNGYEIECIPLKTKMYFGEDTLMTNMAQALVDRMGDISTIITTDEMGCIQHIKNWTEIKSFSRKVLKAFCDTLYASHPDWNEIIPRARFEAQMSMQFASEKQYIESSDDLQLLFSMHGYSVKIGKTESDDTDENGYPMHTVMIGGYGKTDEETGFEDDYFMQAVVTSTIPKEDVKEYIKNAVSMTVGDKYAGDINENFDEVDYQDATVTSMEDYEYFYNGWPCDMEHTKIVDMMGVKSIETNRAVWTYRAWGEFVADENSESSKL